MAVRGEADSPKEKERFVICSTTRSLSIRSFQLLVDMLKIRRRDLGSHCIRCTFWPPRFFNRSSSQGTEGPEVAGTKNLCWQSCSSSFLGISKYSEIPIESAWADLEKLSRIQPSWYVVGRCQSRRQEREVRGHPIRSQLPQTSGTWQGLLHWSAEILLPGSIMVGVYCGSVTFKGATSFILGCVQLLLRPMRGSRCFANKVPFLFLLGISVTKKTHTCK